MDEPGVRFHARTGRASLREDRVAKSGGRPHTDRGTVGGRARLRHECGSRYPDYLGPRCESTVASMGNMFVIGFKISHCIP